MQFSLWISVCLNLSSSVILEIPTLELPALFTTVKGQLCKFLDLHAAIQHVHCTLILGLPDVKLPLYPLRIVIS